MPRKRKRAIVEYPLRFNEFIPVKGNGEVRLSSEEVEALRLIGLEKRKQNDAAVLLRVSQPTLSRILSKALEKVAEALVFGKKIVIELDPKPLTKIYRCLECRFTWVSPIGYVPQSCPSCGSKELEVVE